MIRFVLETSRPRFWLYLAGPYLVGYTAGAPMVRLGVDPLFVAWLAVFLVPANLLLYGLNDLCDGDTDTLNPKKGARENLLAPAQTRPLVAALVVAAILTLAAISLATSVALVGLWALFLFLSVAYSAPPLRLKARPVVDSLSNVLYGVPGFIGYTQASGELPPVAAVAAVTLWTAAMHLLSAVPDIDADRRAGLVTTAVRLGARASLGVCAALWLGAAAVAFAGLPMRSAALVGVVYPVVALWLAARTARELERAYWLFPYINGVAGFALFAAAFVSKPHA